MDPEYAKRYRTLFEAHWWWRSRSDLVLETLSRWLKEDPNRRLLDVGCGEGLFFSMLSRFGRVEGVESDPELVPESGRFRERIHLRSFDRDFRPPHAYGLILMLDVLEHMPDPEGALRHARRLLEPGGLLVVTVPASPILWSNHDVLNRHFRRYTKRSLEELAGRAGVRIHDSRYFFHWTWPVKLLIRGFEKLARSAPAPPSVPSRWLNSAAYRLSRLEQRALTPLSLPFGTSLMMIGGSAESRREHSAPSDFEAERVEEEVRAVEPAGVRGGEAVEACLAGAGLLALTLAAVVLTGSTALFDHALWLDEFHSVLVARQSSPGALLAAVGSGGDYNPPLLHLLLWPLGRLWGAVTPTLLRSFALATVLGGLVFVYLLVRREAGVLTSLVGVLAVWAHPQVLEHAFEGRFYGPMLLFGAMLAYVLHRRLADPSRWNGVALALAAAALCTIHYFGVFAWFLLMAVGSYWLRRDDRSPAILLPGLAGPLVLLLCTPLYLAQKRTLSIPTWIPDPTVAQAWQLFGAFLAWLPLSALLFFAVLASWRTRGAEGTESVGAPESATGSGRSWSLLGIFALFPVVLVVFSIVVQPALVIRYALVTALSIGAVAALVAQRQAPWVRVALALGFVVVGAREIAIQGLRAEQFEAQVERLAGAVERAVPPGASLVVPLRHSLYPLALGPDAPSRRLVFPVLDRDRARANLPYEGRLFLVEQDVALAHEATFGFPTTVPIDRLAAQDTLYFVRPSIQVTAGGYLSLFFPGHDVQQVEADIFRLSRPSGDERTLP